MSKRKKSKARSHDEGLWLVTAEGKWIEVKKKAIKSDNIVPPIDICYGKPFVEGKPIEQVFGVSYPNSREDASTLIKERFAVADFTAENLFPKDPIAETKYTKFIDAVIKTFEEIPLAPPKNQGGPGSTRRGMVDRHLKPVEEYDKYQNTGINEAGRPILKQFPYLTTTHQIYEKDQVDGTLKVLPRILYDVWLPEMLYELYALDDGGRFALYQEAQKLNNYPFPVMEDGVQKMDGDGQPMVSYDEAMLYYDGYVAQSGSSKQYAAFIIPVQIQGKEGPQFIFEMKLTKAAKKYSKLMDVPKEGEVPVTVTGKQMVTSTVEEMLKLVTVTV